MALADKIATSSIHLLTVGLEPHELKSLSHVFKHCKTSHIPLDINQLASGAIASASDSGAEIKPDLIVCGEPITAVSLAEVAQTIRMTFPSVPMFSVVRNRKNYDRKDLIKNGFTDAFLFPLEAGALRRAVFVTLNKLTNGVVKAYRPVRLNDLRPDTILPCKIAIYLPVNNKYVHFLNEDVVFSGAHLEKLRSHRITSVYVYNEDLPAFYEYAVKGIRAIDPNVKMSMTERRHRLEDEVRRLIGGMFRAGQNILIEDGQKLVEELQNVVRSYILDFPSHELRYQIISMMGEMQDSYTHSINVATYGALFSIAFEIGVPADVALAGLLHDIGQVELPEAVVLKPLAEHNEEDTPIFKKHVEASIAVMQEHKLTVGGSTMKAVYQHHERADGSGYPSNMVKAGISKEALMVALADQFDYSTRYIAGTPVLHPEELLEKFRKEMLDTGKSPLVDAELVKKVLGLFPKE